MIAAGQRILAGTSGARIIIGDDAVLKTSDVPGPVRERLGAQARWLRARANVGGLPRVIEIRGDGYLMHRLDELDDRTTPTCWLLAGYAKLRGNLWTRLPPAEGSRFDGAALRAYIVARGSLVSADALDAILGWLETFEGFRDCTWVDTHGDPTLDNLMHNYGGDPVFIDPLPPSPTIPGLRAVDLGKMLQSAYGYEAIKYDDPTRWAIDRPAFEMALNQSENHRDMHAARLWCAIHYLRLLPYQREELKRERYRAVLDTVLAGL